MKYRFTIYILFILGLSQLNAQTLGDVVRNSFYNPSGSARFTATGGAMSALGADYSAISLNPAGLGAYWTSEFVFTPSLLSHSVDARLGDNLTASRNFTNLKFDNFGLIVSNKPRKGALKAFNTAIGMNRIADFNANFDFSGATIGTITERFAERANGNNVNDLDLFEADLAYATGAIYAPDENNIYATDFIESDIVRKQQNVSQSGGINELVFALGANVNNRFLFGASFGVPFLNYESSKIYEEFDPNDEIPAFNSLRYDEFLSTSGIGYNVKAGLIVKLIEALSISGAIHSPTFYTLTDNYSTAMVYSFTETGNVQTLEEFSPDGNFRYRMRTPWKALGGIAFKKKVGKFGGFLSGDIEYIDYRNASLNLTAFSVTANDRALQNDINTQVEQQLVSALNLKLGGELLINKFRLRGGYVLTGSPYAGDEGIYFPSYSAGLGWREDRFYIDLAYRISTIDEGYIPYLVLDDNRNQVVENTIQRNKLIVTVGFQF